VKHLEEEEIALFVDGKFDEIDENSVAGHLRECEPCRREYKAAVLMSWFWREDREALKPSADAVENGMAAAAPSRSGETRVSRVSHRAWSALRTAPAAAAAVVLVGATALWLAIGGGGGGPGTDPLIDPLYTSGKMVSSRTSFVIPGTENDFRPDAPVYRSNHLDADQKLTAALIHFTDKKHSGRASRDELYWLTVGFVAADQLDEAAISAGDALQRYPEDGDFLTLAAVISCLNGDCAESAQLLRDALEFNPLDPVTRLNLAVVLMRTGHRVEAQDLLRGIVSAKSKSPLTERARLLLQ
jgi:hypothetical protein